MAVEVKGVKYKGEFKDVQYDNPAFTNNNQDNGLHQRQPATENADVATTPYSYPKTDSTNVAVENEEIAPASGNKFTQFVAAARSGCSSCWKSQRKIWIIIILVVLLLLYFAYFGYAMYVERLSNEDAIRLCWVTVLTVFLIIVSLVWDAIGENIKKCAEPCTDQLSRHSNKISWIAVTILFTFIIIFVLVDVLTITKQPYNLMSAVGILVYIALFFIFSYSPAHVQWKAVVWGLCLQFLFALIILRWNVGFLAFKWLGDRVIEFLSYSDVGAEFLFGANFRDHFFAFSVLPTVVFFSCVISVLFYVGVMMAVIRKVSWVLEGLMGTTAGESLNAAGNIFVGQTEAPLMIRPLLPTMTRSEIHAVMTGGFATIAGGVLAAYVKMGVPGNHLISASVMSAPAALAMSKLFYPETEVSKTTAADVKNLKISKERNIVEAASAGASMSVKLVANIAANLIAFLAILAFVNATLTWFGSRVGLERPLTFELICSYLLWPFAFIMGIEPVDCFRVAEWIGTKTFLNEFIAYDRLGGAINHTDMLRSHIAANGSWDYGPVGHQITVYNFTNPKYGSFFNETVLEHGQITDRTMAIATYALCGFSNVGSIGIQLGGLGAMAPSRKSDLARVAVRAMIAGNVACFMTACIAGLFYKEKS